MLAALVLAAAATGERLGGNAARPHSALLFAVLIAGITAPLAVRSRAPLATALGGVLGMEAWTATLGSNDGPMTILLAFMFNCYTGGAHPDPRRARWALLAIVLAAVTVPLVSLPSANPLQGSDVMFALALGAVPWAGGRVNARRHRRAEELRALAVELEEARAAEERVAALAERARIAAELNGAVTHGVAEVLMQANAAAGLFDRDPERAAAVLRAVQDGGRATLGELRRMLVVMRQP